jgi:hypothetical protein
MGKKKGNRGRQNDDSDDDFVDPIEAARLAELASLQATSVAQAGGKKPTKAQLRKQKQAAQYVFFCFVFVE